MRNSREQRRHWLKIIIAVCLLIALFGLGIAIASSIQEAKENNADSVYSNIAGKVKSKMHEIIPFKNGEKEQRKLRDEKPLHILLLSEDQQRAGSASTKALAVLEIEPKNKKMELIYIPKEINVTDDGEELEGGSSQLAKFNGVDDSMETVEDFLAIELDYYVQVNVEVLADIVDAVDGITVQNEFDSKGQKGFPYAKGELQLDGAQTMDYIRVQAQGLNGKFDRLKRQVQVAEALMEKVASLGTISLASEMYHLVNKNVKTNMNLETMIDVLTAAIEVGQSLEIVPVSG